MSEGSEFLTPAAHPSFREEDKPCFDSEDFLVCQLAILHNRLSQRVGLEHKVAVSLAHESASQQFRLVSVSTCACPPFKLVGWLALLLPRCLLASWPTAHPRRGAQQCPGKPDSVAQETRSLDTGLLAFIFPAPPP